MAVSQFADQAFRARTLVAKTAAATLTASECKFTRVTISTAGLTITLPTVTAAYQDADIEICNSGSTVSYVILTGNTAADDTVTVAAKQRVNISSNGSYWYSTVSPA